MVILGVLVFIHELGHFLVAKRSGIKVLEFALGFGPPLLRVRRGETCYAVRVIPLGGYVRLAGMDMPVGPGSDARPPEPGDFNSKPLLHRMATISAGPLMNFALAILLFAGYFSSVAIPPTVVHVPEGSPAALGGLQEGDEIIAVGGARAESAEEVVRAIRSHRDTPLELKARRDGKIVELRVTPRYDPDRKIVSIGMAVFSQERQSVPRALVLGASYTYNIARQTVEAAVSMITGRTRADLFGPVGIFQAVRENAARGIAFLVFTAAVLNVNLGLLNFLPIPVLDGGWLVFLALEGIRGKPLAPEHRGIAQFIGLTLLLLLLLFATYRDVVRLNLT